MPNKDIELARGRNFADPFVRLLMSGMLNLTGEPNAGVKTAKQPVSATPDQYMFLRTSGKIFADALSRSSLVTHPKERTTRVINGVARLDETRALTPDEKYRLFLLFNNLEDNQLSKKYFLGEEKPGWFETGLTWPLAIGLFFQDIKPFPKPIPWEMKPGPVNTFKVARDRRLIQALHSVGLHWKDVTAKQ